MQTISVTIFPPQSPNIRYHTLLECASHFYLPTAPAALLLLSPLAAKPHPLSIIRKDLPGLSQVVSQKKSHCCQLSTPSESRSLSRTGLHRLLVI